MLRLLFLRISSIYQDSLRPLKLVMIFMSLLAAIGMGLQKSQDPHDDLIFLTNVMPWIIWSSLFFLHAMLRYIGLFSKKLMPYTKHVYFAASSLGIWLWTMLFVGAAIMTPIETMSMIYGILILSEVWILSRSVVDYSGKTPGDD